MLLSGTSSPNAGLVRLPPRNCLAKRVAPGDPDVAQLGEEVGEDVGQRGLVIARQAPARVLEQDQLSP
jgi:hypothetical protein